MVFKPSARGGTAHTGPQDHKKSRVSHKFTKTFGKSYMGGLGSMGYVRSFFRDFVFFRVAFYAYDPTVQLEYDSTLSSNVS